MGLWKDKLSGGKADQNKPSDFDQTQLNKGEKVESEHTTNKHIRKEIAMDHLTENDDYYAILPMADGKKMTREMCQAIKGKVKRGKCIVPLEKKRGRKFK